MEEISGASSVSEGPHAGFLAPVAQWIEQRFPKPRAQVRFLSGALLKSPQKCHICRYFLRDRRRRVVRPPPLIADVDDSGRGGRGAHRGHAVGKVRTRSGDLYKPSAIRSYERARSAIAF